MIRLIWTKSNKPLSIGIRWCLDEPTSHFGIVFDDKIVFHSNLLGVHLNSFYYIKKTSDIVYSRELELGLSVEEDIFQSIEVTEGNGYDLKGFAYFTYRGLLYKIKKTPLPSFNPYGSHNEYLCTELASKLPGFLFKSGIKPDLAMTSPFKLYEMIGQS